MKVVRTDNQKKKFISKWKENTEKARYLVSARQSHQMEIAQLALEVCEISWGGSHMKDKYTMRKFAQDIGVNPKTLSNYISVKVNVFDKLDPKFKNKVGYTVLHHAARRITRHNTAKQVNEIMQESVAFDGEERKLLNYARHLRSCMHLLEKHEAIETVSDDILGEVLFFSQGITRLIKTRRKKIKPAEGNFTSRYNYKWLSAAEALGIQRKKPKLGLIKVNDIDEPVRITKKEQEIILHMKAKKRFMGPTEIGMAVGGRSRQRASSWAIRSLRKLVEAGLAERNEKGLYKLVSPS